ncbi:MAG: GIY-YIG nuclease family protein [Pirellulaceae bacterium]|nr:GIY-YIG nuclease family protein [Pirellulaceae bacterium]
MRKTRPQGMIEHCFADFGADALNPLQPVVLRRIEAEHAPELRDQVRRLVPRLPGVYGMVDVLGRLIYVGKSKALRNRLLSYFLPGNEEDKSGRIVQSTRAIVWETQPSEFAALIREQALIRQFQPRLNVQGMPRRQQPVFVGLGRPPAEQLFVSRRSESSAVVQLGPLFGAQRAARAVEVLNRHFRLRDCSTSQPCSFSEQMQLFDIELRPGCIRLEIGSCLGPCISACSRGQYSKQVSAASQFLAGRDDSVLAEMETQMLRAAQNHQFEQAARIREDLRAVKWLSHRAAEIARASQRYTFVYALPPSVKGAHGIWYLIRRGMIEGAVTAPRSEAEASQLAPLLQRWWTEPNLVGSVFSARPETLALIASWFRCQPTELKRTFRLPADGQLPPQCWQSCGPRVSVD